MQSHRCSSFPYYCKMNIIVVVVVIIIIHPVKTLITKYIVCLLFKLFDFSHLPPLTLSVVVLGLSTKKLQVYTRSNRLFRTRQMTANSYILKHGYLQQHRCLFLWAYAEL